MSSAKLTLIGINNYLLKAGDNLFKEMVLPEGLDIETLTDTIILNGAEFEVLYSNPKFFQDAIGNWSKKWYRTIDKWVKALAVEYSPLENYDRIEEWTENETNSNNFNSNENSNGNSNSNTKVSAFNSSSLVPESSNDLTNNYSGTTSGSNNGLVDSIHKGRIHGNIGVTTSQQMLQSELDLAYWNLYEKISALFLSEFVIPVY